MLKIGDFVSYKPYADSETTVKGRIMSETTLGKDRAFVVKTPTGEVTVNANICSLLPKRAPCKK